MKNLNLQIACLLAALAVALGAFGAHALKELLNEQQLHTYQTAVQYHFYHVLGLAIVGILQLHGSSKWMRISARLFFAGIILFSGSLYLMSFLNAASVDGFDWLGAITPLGGISFIAGWVCLFFAVKEIRH